MVGDSCQRDSEFESSLENSWIILHIYLLQNCANEKPESNKKCVGKGLFLKQNLCKIIRSCRHEEASCECLARSKGSSVVQKISVLKFQLRNFVSKVVLYCAICSSMTPSVGSLMDMSLPFNLRRPRVRIQLRFFVIELIYLTHNTKTVISSKNLANKLMRSSAKRNPLRLTVINC